jgi:hypothetical protein
VFAWKTAHQPIDTIKITLAGTIGKVDLGLIFQRLVDIFN